MYENYYGVNPADEKQKKRIIIVSLVMGIIILVLIGVLVNAIVKKNHIKSGDTQGQIAVVDESQNSEPEARTTEDAESENLAPVENTADAAGSTADDKTTENIASASTTKTTNLPQSGPSDYFGLALLLGSLTAYALSKKNAVANV